MEWDLSNLDAGTRQEIDDIMRKDMDLQIVKMMDRQKRLAIRAHKQPPRAIDGFGGKVLQIDAFLDAYWRRVYGHNYTENPDLLNFLKKRNPEIVVKHTGTKIQIGWRPNGRSLQKSFYNTYEPRDGRKQPEIVTGGSSVPKFRKVYSPA